MDQVIQKSLSHFFIAGISYEKAESSIRGLYAVDEAHYMAILKEAKAAGIPEMFVLSTCNRTEVYGFARDAEQLTGLLTRHTKGPESQFRELRYVYQGQDAVRHLYRVAAGLDSQILGDYEIISQVKAMARFAKTHQMLGTFTERLINSVLQVSKQIKNETRLSAGTVSVAFAAIQFLKSVPGIRDKRILLVGTGKIGRNTCKNLITYLGAEKITLTNRTLSTARDFAEEHGLRAAPFHSLAEELDGADVILVATNAPTPTVRASQFRRRAPRIILDLSIPENVSGDVGGLADTTVINVDTLSRIQDETLCQRRGEIPKAEAIIEEQMKDFLYWYQMRKHAVLLHAVKQKMEQIHTNEIRHQKISASMGREDLDEVSSRIIQKMVNMFAGKLRQANGQAENYLQVLSEIFETPVKE
jgi:glutamyl-tRNA reductase